jgi:hypothetical protein
MTLFLKAVQNLIGTAGFELHGDDAYENIVKWYCDLEKIPTKEQVTAEHDRLKAEWAATQYQRDRAKEYPPIGEQLDALWHGMDTGVLSKIEPFYSNIKAVKDKYPR